MIGYTYPDGPGQPSIITPLNAAFYMTSTLQQMGKPVVVTNNAVNGTEVGELLSGSNGYAAPWSQAVYGVSGKVVIANYGINDSFRGDETPEQYGRNLVTWVTVARDAGKTPVLEEPNPVCRSDISNLDAYVAQIGAVATQMNVPLIKQYDYIKSLPTWQSLLSDCIHPTPSLYQIKGQREAQVLASLIG
jgi:lysophospholipase L1-like esterase